MLEHLLDVMGVHIDARAEFEDETALMLACDGGHGLAASLLLARAADPTLQDRSDWSVLHHAAMLGHAHIVQQLADTGRVDVNVQDRHGRAPLWWAAHYGHVEVVRVLLATAQADVTLRAIAGQTALGIASSKSHEEVVRMLQEAEAQAATREGL